MAVLFLVIVWHLFFMGLQLYYIYYILWDTCLSKLQDLCYLAGYIEYLSCHVCSTLYQVQHARILLNRVNTTFSLLTGLMAHNEFCTGYLLLHSCLRGSDIEGEKGRITTNGIFC